MTNKKIRCAAKQYGVRLWQVAEALGMQDSALSKKLRHELPENEQSMIIDTIKRIAGEADQ